MQRIFSGSLLTAAITIGPPRGFKWRIINSYVKLVTSANAGTRRVQLAVSVNGTANLLVSDTGSQTTVSSTFIGLLESVNAAGINANTAVIQATEEVYLLGGYDTLLSVITLIAGDTYSFFLEMEETEA